VSAVLDGASRLDGHDAQFRALVATATRHHARGRLDAAAAYAQMAGQFAWMNHTGRFASAELEDLLARIAERLPPLPHAVAATSDPRDVLHVITQTYQTGGPTQVLSCWLEQDAGRRHRVCITRQGSTPPPEKLLSQLDGPAGLVRLDLKRGGLVARARELRALAAQADVVLLHTHPYDVVPVIAFAGVQGLPPVIVVNHSDHVFWLGTGITGVLANMRDSGRRLAAARRGLDDARSTIHVRPLRSRERELSREEAKRRLGIRPDQVLLVTAADAPKYRAVSAPSFLDLMIPVLERHADAVFLAAGPAPDGEWAAAGERSGGRIRALGRLPDVTPLHEAADVYVDSFPFSSLTSLLEAGSYGTPAVTYRGHPEDCGVLGADTPGIDPHLLRPTDAAGFAAALDRAIGDEPWRRELGERTRRAIRDTHTGAGWQESVAALYAFAAQTRPSPAPGSAARGTGTLDVLVDQVMTRTGFAQGPAGAVRDHLGLLPLPQRVPASVRVLRAGHVATIRHVAPEWMLPRLGDAWRFTRRLRHATA
jgi:glycosyltransferase involved in cell wall biosynthesis